MPLVLIRVTEVPGRPVVDVIELEKKEEQPKPKCQPKPEPVKPVCPVKEDSVHRLTVRLVSLVAHNSVRERTIAINNLEAMLEDLHDSIECMRPGASKINPEYDFDPKLAVLKTLVWMALETSRRRMEPTNNLELEFRTWAVTERSKEINGSDLAKKAGDRGLARDRLTYDLMYGRLSTVQDLAIS